LVACPLSGNRASVTSAGALAARIALARMSSDNVIPRDRAVSARTSRSCGSRRTATRAVRRRDSERGRAGA
jgi:hypothetical protein